MAQGRWVCRVWTQTVLRTVFASRGVGPVAQLGLQGLAKQFKRLRKVVKRQRTILGVVIRELQRKLDAQAQAIAPGGVPDKAP